MDDEYLYKSFHDARHRDLVRTGGAVCPKCGNKWDDSRQYPIYGTQMRGKGLFRFRKYPAYVCSKCGYTWKMIIPKSRGTIYK